MFFFFQKINTKLKFTYEQMEYRSGDKTPEDARSDRIQHLGERTQTREVENINSLRIEGITLETAIYFSEDKCIIKLMQIGLIVSIQ